MNRGAIYVSVNEGSAKEATRSAEQLKNVMPDLPITIHTEFEVDEGPFDNIIRIPHKMRGFEDRMSYPDQGFLAKARYAGKAPYDHCLFLDTETWVTQPLNDLFKLLDRFDMGAAHDSGRFSYKGIPHAYGGFNTGVILYRNNEVCQEVFSNWWDNYSANVKNDAPWSDQPCFQKAVWDVPDLKFVTLPVEYNCRFIFPCAVWSKVAILHGRPGDYPEVTRKINEHYNQPRCFWNDREIVRFKK